MFSKDTEELIIRKMKDELMGKKQKNKQLINYVKK